MECGFCKKTLSTPYVLANHQRTVKSCIKIQVELGSKVEKLFFECKFCKKKLTAQSSLKHHYTICKTKLKQAKLSVEEKTRLLENELEDKFEQISSDLRNYREEIGFEMKLQDEKIKKLENQSQMNKKSKKASANVENIEKKIETNIETNIGTNIENQTNHITIYQVMTPELVEDFFRKNYSLDAPEALVKQEYSPPPLEDYAKASVNYFKTTGRDNTPAPADRQTTAAKPADFFPLRGQAAPSRNTEMARQLGIGSVVHATIPPSPAYGFADISTPVRGRSRHRSPSIARDEEFYSPSQAKSSAHGEAISLTKRASSAARASMNTLHEEEVMPSKRHGGSVFR